MVEALKKIDKKFLIIAGAIILLPILLIIILAIIQGCSNSKITHEKYEQKMITAAKNYIEDKKLEIEESEVVNVKLSDLIDGEYIKDTEKLLGDTTCDGSVTVRLNGSTVEENEGGYINYIASLKCDEYSSNSLKNDIMNSLTTTGSGLYQVGSTYIYKGDEPKNYIEFFGKQYRIISIDSNGIVKLLSSESDTIEREWDIKYNVDTNDTSGKNIYADSAILKYLLGYYNDSKKVSSSAKEHIVAYDICSGARAIDNLALNTDSECSVKLENQVVSLLGVTDYASASLDPDCVDISSKSCRNYNYMKGLFLDNWTLTPVSTNSYEVYYIYNGLIKYQSAKNYASYNPVIYIDGNEILNSGDGSEKTPYIIK